MSGFFSLARILKLHKQHHKTQAYETYKTTFINIIYSCSI